jgi:hypothetical protein
VYEPPQIGFGGGPATPKSPKKQKKKKKKGLNFGGWPNHPKADLGLPAISLGNTGHPFCFFIFGFQLL